MSARRELHLNVNLLHAGVYPSAWRLPESRPDAFVDVDHYVRVARVAERGKLDAIFLADTPAINDRIDHRPFMALEPTIVLASVAAATTHVGLIATASTSYNEPYNLARRFATLDLVSRGRVGWNVVTTADAAAGRNFGFAGPPSTGALRPGPEFTQVVHALWDSWEDDALVGDKASGASPTAPRFTPSTIAAPITASPARSPCRARRRGGP